MTLGNGPPFHSIEVEFTVETDLNNHTHITAKSIFPEGNVERSFYILRNKGVCGVTTNVQPAISGNEAQFNEEYPLNAHQLPWDEPLGSELVNASPESGARNGGIRIRDFAFEKHYHSQLEDYGYLTGEPEPELNSAETEFTPSKQDATDLQLRLRFEQIKTQWRGVAVFDWYDESTSFTYSRTENDTLDVYRNTDFLKRVPILDGMVKLDTGQIESRTIGPNNQRISPPRYIWYDAFEELAHELDYDMGRPNVPYSDINTVFTE